MPSNHGTLGDPRMEGWVSEGMKTVFVFVVRTAHGFRFLNFFSVTTLFMPVTHLTQLFLLKSVVNQ